ncbi:hypothetical protein R1flu_001623 [Riccia fluitans]|uniref:Uncharacterized protein n=1 Tax=Riccia fluitans TaxID=41844 RepID=A0ABD1Y3T0_9MARC
MSCGILGRGKREGMRRREPGRRRGKGIPIDCARAGGQANVRAASRVTTPYARIRGDSCHSLLIRGVGFHRGGQSEE